MLHKLRKRLAKAIKPKQKASKSAKKAEGPKRSVGEGLGLNAAKAANKIEEIFGLLVEETNKIGTSYRSLRPKKVKEEEEDEQG